jgi:phosphatidylglycerol---prolipoprotein diacylglyceryl transferase
MFPILVSTPWFNVYSYGLFIAIGYTVGTLWIVWEARREGLSGEALFDMLLIQMVVGIAGSRLLYLLEYSDEPLTLQRFLAFEQGGLTFYGAVIASFLWDWFFLRWKGIPFWRAMDCVGMGLPLGIFFSRLGCFLNGCCHGVACEWPWGVVFRRVSPTAMHPTQLYESMAGLAIFFALQWFRSRRRNYGEAFLGCMAGYGGLRFLIEFFRGDNPILALGLTLSQWLGLGAVAVAAAVWHFIRRTPSLRIMPTGAIAAANPPGEEPRGR